MARVNRREVLSESEVQAVHCVNRCVRRGFLCGQDPVTGQDYEHRRQWIRDRLEFLAGVFGIDVMGFAVMSNHLHAVLRSRPDVVATWSDEDVARRWWNLFPRRRNEDGSPAEPAETDLNMILADAAVLAERRARLSSISWFMRCTSEVIARRANHEDECTGRFWEGRFKAQVLPDEAAIAACMAYVDLNPIRAGIAKTPERSDYTSAKERIADVKSAAEVSTADAKDLRAEHGERAGWLSPVELEPPRRKVRERKTSRRCSNKGCVPLSLADYLTLLDWTGRQVRAGQQGMISSKAPPILKRLELSADLWLHMVQKFGAKRTVSLSRIAAPSESHAARPSTARA